VPARIREEFAQFFRPYARGKHRHSIFFSDQLLGTPWHSIWSGVHPGGPRWRTEARQAWKETKGEAPRE
jgi:hypothetical protein